MKKSIFAFLCILLFCSHDMYLKMDTYFLNPNQQSEIQLYNGTFDKSENVIDRDRMLDASLVGNGKRMKIDDSQWTEKDSITFLNFKSGDAGTWVAGVSTKARNIAMEADKFNNYLKHDGVIDMLSQREKNGTLTDNAVEKYSKHVKTIFQIGNSRSDDWKTSLGYPIEFIPLENPYEKHTGDKLQIKLLRNGKPLANQLVYANFAPSKNGHSHTDNHHHSDETTEHSHNDENHSHENENNHHNIETHSHKKENEEHSHGNKTHSHKKDEEAHAHTDDENHTHTTGQELRTDENGVLTVNLTDDGIWYVRTINLVNSDEEGLTHESNWATLTFEITHNHNETTHTHEHEEGIPTYIFVIGSILLIGILFFIFNRKK